MQIQHIDGITTLIPDAGHRFQQGDILTQPDEPIYLGAGVDPNTWREVKDVAITLFDVKSDILININGVIPDITQLTDSVEVNYVLDPAEYWDATFASHVPIRAKSLKLTFKSSVSCELSVQLLHADSRKDSSVHSLDSSDEMQELVVPLDPAAIQDEPALELSIGQRPDDPGLEGTFTLMKIEAML